MKAMKAKELKRIMIERDLVRAKAKGLRVLKAKGLKMKKLKALVGKKKAKAIMAKHLKLRAKVARLEAKHRRAVAKLIIGKKQSVA